MARRGEPLGESPLGQEGLVSSVAFSLDGKTIASASVDGTLRLWDGSTGKPLGEPLRGLEGGAFSVAFSPDENALAIGSGDGTIRLLSGVSARERMALVRTRMAEVELVRTQLEARIATVDDTIASVRAFAAEVRADPRFSGVLRTAALIVVGEVDLSRQEARAPKEAASRERLIPLLEAAGKADWALALKLAAAASPDDLALFGASQWRLLAWNGLTALPEDSPARDLTQLLGYAERAVTISGRHDGPALSTLARAHWELGDKSKALEIQREAIEVAERAGMAESPLAELKTTLARYEATEPPKPPAGQTDSES